jgi:hypothetical protein
MKGGIDSNYPQEGQSGFGRKKKEAKKKEEIRRGKSLGPHEGPSSSPHQKQHKYY